LATPTQQLRSRATQQPNTQPAESPYRNLCTLLAEISGRPKTAENHGKLRCFSADELTGRNDEDCYTFEHFAAGAVVIRSAYYYHYKRERFGLKEETTWS
jgi:hypothetical protein